MCMHTVKWLNSSIWPIDETLTGTTTTSQSGHGNNGNEGILHILQSSRIWASPLDGLEAGESYSSAEMQSTYSTAPADRGRYRGVGTSLILDFQLN